MTAPTADLPWKRTKEISSCDHAHNLALAEPGANPLTHYIIVRNDMPLGVLAAQVTHAAGESSPGNLTPGTYAVVLAAQSAQELEDLHDRLADLQVPHSVVRESSGPLAGQMTAIGVQPAPREEVKRLFSSMPLLK